MQSGQFAPRNNSGRRRNHWSRRKRIAVGIVLLMILAPFAAAGAYVWQISQAIEDVQDQAVVELPDSSQVLGGVRTPTAEANPGSSGATPEPDHSGSPSGNHPSATATSNNGSVQAQGTDPEPAETQAPEPTKESSGDSDAPGSFSIMRDLVGTGTGTDRVNPREIWPDQDHINILVLGVDTRETEGDQNADVIIIARVDFTDNTVRAVSIPRDLEVEVPGFGPSKINGAYNVGVQNDPENQVAGVLSMRDTIEYNFGIKIDEFVLVDFQGFESVIDAVGGITINVPERIEDDAYPTEDFGTTTLVIEEGRQHMDGETALAYARTRHQDSDDHRRERQMLVLRALLNKGQSLGSFTKVTQVIKASGDAVLTSIDWNEQLALANIALKLDQNDLVMENITEPMVTPGTSANGAWIYVGDPTEIGTFIEQVLSGEYVPESTPVGG